MYKDDYCTCNGPRSVTTGTDYDDDFGYWYVCTTCNKRLEDGYHYYNHFDGEDHEDIDME